MSGRRVAAVPDRGLLLVDAEFAEQVLRVVGQLWRAQSAAGAAAPAGAAEVVRELRDGLAATSASGSGNPFPTSDRQPPSSEPSWWEWPSTTAAAERLNVSTRRVTQMLAEGQLAGVKQQGRWHIDPASIADLQGA